MPHHKNMGPDSKQALETLEYSAYGASIDDNSKDTSTANAFNFMVHTSGNWSFLSQAHLLIPGPKGFTAKRNTDFPIHQSVAHHPTKENTQVKATV